MQKTKKAFTLVELIVVITILAILGTISFISLQGYSKKARDSKRTSDIANIKVSLELFSLNTGYYPLPDNGEEVLYDNDLLWTQGIVGDNVTTNLSRNLLKKPTDPLHDIEYIYSLASSKKEYEVMSVYEGDLANNNLIDSTYASDKYNIKVEGNYNELFIKTSRHIFPVPSLITSAMLPLDFDLVPSAIESQVITGGSNFPGLSIPNTETSTGGLKVNLSVYVGSITKDSIDDVKKAVVEKIQLAYSGSDIETTGVYKTLLEKTTDDELLAFVDDVVLSNSSSSVIKDNEAPTGGDFSMDIETNTVDITLTITCPEEDLVEMYISGDIVGTSEWEACIDSKDVELTGGEGSKNIGIKWRDNDENESIEVSNDISFKIYIGNISETLFNRISSNWSGNWQYCGSQSEGNILSWTSVCQNLSGKTIVLMIHSNNPVDSKSALIVKSAYSNGGYSGNNSREHWYETNTNKDIVTQNDGYNNSNTYGIFSTTVSVGGCGVGPCMSLDSSTESSGNGGDSNLILRDGTTGKGDRTQDTLSGNNIYDTEVWVRY